MDKPMTTQGAAAELGYSVRHLYRLLDDETIQGERFGHVWMIDRQEAGQFNPVWITECDEVQRILWRIISGEPSMY